MVDPISPETVMIITPIIALGTALFNYVLNTIRNDNLKFTLKEFLIVLGSSLVYAIALGIFSYFFYKIVIEYLYGNFKSIIMKTEDGSFEVAATEVKHKNTPTKKKNKVKEIVAEETK